MQTLRISLDSLLHTHTPEFLRYTKDHRAERLNEVVRELADMFGVRVRIESQSYILAEQCPIREQS